MKFGFHTQNNNWQNELSHAQMLDEVREQVVLSEVDWMRCGRRAPSEPRGGDFYVPWSRVRELSDGPVRGQGSLKRAC